MQLVLPEILEQARGLSLPLLIAGAIAGLVLWAVGYWSHRFWIVLSATLLGGLFGLYEASLLNMQPFLAALLLAVAAGMLGLSLMRLLAFAGGGISCLLLMKALVPSADAAAVCFLAGGVIATMLFRLWLMLLTSALGVLLAAHCLLSIGSAALGLNAMRLADQQKDLLNWVCAAVALLGCLMQFAFDRARRKRSAKKKSKDSSDSGSSDKSAKKNKDHDGLRWFPFRKAA